MGRHSILAVFAHPGDETWINGTVALIALKYENFNMVYVTSGEVGSDVSNRGLKGETLAREREVEAHSALEILGVHNPPIFFRLPDSSLDKEEYQALMQEKLNSVFKTLSPEIVLTFGEDGLTGHKDHQLVGVATRRAADIKGSASLVLNVALSQKRREALCRYAGELGMDLPSLVPASSVDNGTIDLNVNVNAFAERRMVAMAAHKTRHSQALIDLWRTFVRNQDIEELVISRYHSNIFKQMTRIFSDKSWSGGKMKASIH